MNRLIDLVKNWGYKLSYNLMRLSGASDEALKRYLTMVSQNKEADAEADAELKPHRNNARIIIIILVAVGAWFGFRYLKRKRII
jgi:hypothetical protein